MENQNDIEQIALRDGIIKWGKDVRDRIGSEITTNDQLLEEIQKETGVLTEKENVDKFRAAMMVTRGLLGFDFNKEKRDANEVIKQINPRVIRKDADRAKDLFDLVSLVKEKTEGSEKLHPSDVAACRHHANAMAEVARANTAFKDLRVTIIDFKNGELQGSSGESSTNIGHRFVGLKDADGKYVAALDLTNQVVITDGDIIAGAKNYWKSGEHWLEDTGSLESPEWTEIDFDTYKMRKL